MLVLIFHRESKGLERLIKPTSFESQVDPLDLGFSALLEFQGDENYEHSNILEEAWALTQEKGVEIANWSTHWQKDKPRPTREGDVIQLENGLCYLVKSEGFQLLYQLPLIHVPKVEGLVETGDDYFVYPTLENWYQEKVDYCKYNPEPLGDSFFYLTRNFNLGIELRFLAWYR